jgi:hypothetical protein
MLISMTRSVAYLAALGAVVHLDRFGSEHGATPDWSSVVASEFAVTDPEGRASFERPPDPGPWAVAAVRPGELGQRTTAEAGELVIELRPAAGR